MPRQPLRPQNRCRECQATWHPRGTNLSRRCPECGGHDVVAVTSQRLLSCLVAVIVYPLLLFGCCGGCVSLLPPTISSRNAASTREEPAVKQVAVAHPSPALSESKPEQKSDQPEPATPTSSAPAKESAARAEPGEGPNVTPPAAPTEPPMEEAAQYTPVEIWRQRTEVHGKFVQVTGKASVEKTAHGYLLRFWNDDKTSKLVIAGVEVPIDGEQVVSVAGIASTSNSPVVIIADALYLPDPNVRARRVIEPGGGEAAGGGPENAGRATASGGAASTSRGLAGAAGLGGPKTVAVRGYTRKDGTYVSPHMRSAPARGRR